MGTTALVLFVVALAVETGLLLIRRLWLWLGRADAPSASRGPSWRKPGPLARRRRPPRRLVPTPDEAVKAVWETVDRVREKGLGGAIRSSIDDLAGWAQVERPALVKLAGADGRVAIFFSDIEGSTELNERLGDKNWVRLLARHDSAVRSAIERHEGQVVKTQGDGFMAAFGSPERAVRSAVAIQQAFDRGRRKRTPPPSWSGSASPTATWCTATTTSSDATWPTPHASPRWPRAARSWSATAWPTRSPTATTSTLAEPREVQLKGLAGEHSVSAVEWAA